MTDPKTEPLPISDRDYPAGPPTWPHFTPDRTIPLALFGKDHWSLFAAVADRAVHYRGLLDHDRMRCDGNRHPIMLIARKHAVVSQSGTRIYLNGARGEYGLPSELGNHDDYDCLNDLAMAGLITVTMPHLDDRNNLFFDADGKTVHAGDYEPLGGPYELVTGYQEQVLATRASWTLTHLGWQVDAELRRFKASGGAFRDFQPTWSACNTSRKEGWCQVHEFGVPPQTYGTEAAR